MVWLQGHLLQDQLRLQALVHAGFHSDDATRVLQLRASAKPAGASVRVNLTGSACFWLNDVETDPAYKCVHDFVPLHAMNGELCAVHHECRTFRSGTVLALQRVASLL